MPRHSTMVKIRRDQAKKQKNNLQVQTPEGQTGALQRQIHPAQLFRDGKVDRVVDQRFGLGSRRFSAQRLGATVGNRNMQQLINHSDSSGSSLIQRSVIQRGIRSWFKKLIGSDPEGAVHSMDTNLERASKILDGASAKAVGNPELLNKLLKVKDGIDNLKSVSSGVTKVLDARDKVRKVWSFVSALESVPDDVASNPEKAAKAFGKVFNIAGELGEMLPKGPWTPYFTFLKGFTNFFSDMLYGLNPNKRPSNRKYREFLP